jgi:hypothetical protein
MEFLAGNNRIVTRDRHFFHKYCSRSKQAVGSDGIGIFKKEMACFICVATVENNNKTCMPSYVNP